MPKPLIDLAGLQVGPEELVAAVLEATGRPLWVVDCDGLIRFASPAAVAALGAESADDLIGRPAPPVDAVSVALPGGGAVVSIAEPRDAALGAQQAALRRVAALVASGAASADVLAAVAKEVAHVTGLPLVAIWRYGPDDTATVVGAWSDFPQPFQVGTRWPLDGPTITARVKQTGRPATIHDFTQLPGKIAESARTTGIGACAGAPIIVDGKLWGAMSIDSVDGTPLPADIEDRLVEFTELVGTTFSTTARQDALARLAEEQAALRRVATLVARERPEREVFAAVAEEVGRLLPIEDTAMMRYEDDGTATVVASWGQHAGAVPAGTRLAVDGDSITTQVLRTGEPARIDDYRDASGGFGTRMRELGIGSAVGCPVVVDGRLWGTMVAAQRQVEPLPADTEARVAQFTELIATAISNIQARAELAASRARIVAATDETRRRFERDLHDGAQQRLVALSLELRNAEAIAPPEQEELRRALTQVADGLTGVLEELRELSRGIHPAILSEGGLAAALRALGRRSAVPMRLDLDVDLEEDLEERLEVAAYYVISEALANTAKHARASSVEVRVRARDGVLDLTVRDDGVGGADPARGSGLIGLMDRVEALAGAITIVSPEGEGTSVRVSLPTAV